MHKNALSAYKNIGLASEIMSASPHRLIQILLEESLRRVALAKQAIEANNIPDRYKYIKGALEAVLMLHASINPNVESEVGKNLTNLYDFIERHLLEANQENSTKHLDEVSRIILLIKEGWDGMSNEEKLPQDKNV